MSENIPYIIAEDGYYYVAYKEKVKVPEIVVSSKGVANGLSEEYNDGWDFGPDTYSPTSTSAIPYTGTSGIQEAVDYVVSKLGGKIFIKNGVYNLTSYQTGVNETACILIPASNNVFPVDIEGESTTTSQYQLTTKGDVQPVPSSNAGVILDASTLDGLSTKRVSVISADWSSSGIQSKNSIQLFIKNITVRTDQTATYPLSGIDCGYGSFAVLENISADITLPSSGEVPAPTSSSVYSIGIRMPLNLNNGKSILNNAYVIGYMIGLQYQSHFVGDNIFIQYCSFALGIGIGSHTASIGYIDIEMSPAILYPINNSGSVPTIIKTLDVQVVSNSTWYSFGNIFANTNPVNMDITIGTWIEVNIGAISPPITSGNIPSGVVYHWNSNVIIPSPSTPSVPASGTAQANSNPYPAKVYVQGGAITEIQVSIGGTTYTVYSNSTASAVYEGFTLPAGASITLTYSTAPTWTWVVE